MKKLLKINTPQLLVFLLNGVFEVWILKTVSKFKFNPKFKFMCSKKFFLNFWVIFDKLKKN